MNMYMLKAARQIGKVAVIGLVRQIGRMQVNK